MSEEKEMSFLDHLEELRWHIIRAVAAIVILAVVAFLNIDIIFGKLILGPSKIDFPTYRALCSLGTWLRVDGLCIQKLGFIIQNRTMTGQFTTHISISILSGFIVAFPYVFWEIWRFIKPGLMETERRYTNFAVAFVTLLFLSGISFGYFILSPLTINFLANYQIDESIQNFVDLDSYISTLTMMVLACGIMFQLPAIVLVAAKAGILTAGLMRKFRKHSFIVILLVAAILTPSPDMFSQLILAIPLYGLFELSILMAASVAPKVIEAIEEAELVE